MKSKSLRNIFVYISFLIFFGMGIYWILNFGKNLETSIATFDSNPFSFAPWTGDFAKNLKHPVSLLLLQLLVILTVARSFGWISGIFGQPTVIGEIVAGIVLGPSLLGWVFPEYSSFLFPKDSLKSIQALSQIGLLLFLFLVGMELDRNALGKKAHDAIVVSHASILFPFFLGTAYALYLYPDFSPKNVSFLVFGLFMGIAMSITAFPVLARIVQERGLTKTSLGTLVVTCAAADDVTAWCILACVVAIAQAGSLAGGLITVALAVLYVFIMIFAVRPLLTKISKRYPSREALVRPVTAFVLIIWLLSCYVAEGIGIHALFGAFLAGVVMPSNSDFRRMLSEKIEDVSLLLLLPLFFVFTGLRTQIGLLNEGNLWMVCFGVIAVAVTGKFFGSSVSAKLVGQNWKDSLAIGAMMNTRGLMELVVLNIGYDLGILSPQIFTMMVLMALVTTFMTGPILDLLNLIFGKNGEENEGRKILLSFAAPASGARLLELANLLFPKKYAEEKEELVALHVTSSADISPREAEILEKGVFENLSAKADELGRNIRTVYKNSPNVTKEIFGQIRTLNPYLILLGRSQTLFSHKEVAGKVLTIVESAEIPVGVLIDRDFKRLKKILFFVSSIEDRFLESYLKEVSNADHTEITALWAGRILPEWMKPFNADPEAKSNVRLVAKERSLIYGEDWSEYDLVVISLGFYGEIENTGLFQQLPSVLILKR